MNIDYRYRRSSFCGGSTCVEVSPLDGGGVALRDSKEPGRSEHTFTQEEWNDFVRGVKAGEFDFAPLTP